MILHLREEARKGRDMDFALLVCVFMFMPWEPSTNVMRLPVAVMHMAEDMSQRPDPLHRLSQTPAPPVAILAVLGPAHLTGRCGGGGTAATVPDTPQVGVGAGGGAMVGLPGVKGQVVHVVRWHVGQEDVDIIGDLVPCLYPGEEATAWSSRHSSFGNLITLQPPF